MSTYGNLQNDRSQRKFLEQLAAGTNGLPANALAPGSVARSVAEILSDFLIIHAANPDSLIVGAITRDANGAAISASVVWPDGTPGAYTATDLSEDHPGAVDGYEITYGDPAGLTVTQPVVTRDENGAVTNRPALTVS